MLRGRGPSVLRRFGLLVRLLLLLELLPQVARLLGPTLVLLCLGRILGFLHGFLLGLLLLALPASQLLWSEIVVIVHGTDLSPRISRVRAARDREHRHMWL